MHGAGGFAETCHDILMLEFLETYVMLETSLQDVSDISSRDLHYDDHYGANVIMKNMMN